MSLGSFFKKQFIDVIAWTEDGPGILQYRYPMQDMEIQNGAQLTVRESQMAVFVNEGVFADIFSPGPLHAQHEDPSAAHQPAELGQALSVAVQVRRLLLLDAAADRPAVGHADAGHDPRQGVRRGSSARKRHLLLPPDRSRGLSAEGRGDAGPYSTDELEPHLRNVIVGKVSDAFGQSGVAFLDMAGNIDELSTAMRAQVGPLFSDFGLALDTFQVESLSLPDELQKLLDQRIGMNMVGDMRQYAQFQAAQSMPIAAANPGGGAGIGAGLGAGLAMGKAMADAISGATVVRRRSGQRRRRPPRRNSARSAASRSRGARSSAPSAARSRRERRRVGHRRAWM